MYKLTPRMLKGFERKLKKYHALFEGGRCEGFHQQELIVKAIESAARGEFQITWKGRTHSDKPDIIIKTEKEEHLLKIRSGKEIEDQIDVSGYRFSKHRNKANKFDLITQFLNSRDVNIICIIHDKKDDEAGRRDVYNIYYLDINKLKGISPTGWLNPNTFHIQTNSHGVEFSLRPAMSWQIWWKVPKNLFEEMHEIVIPKKRSILENIQDIVCSIINRILRKNV